LNVGVLLDKFENSAQVDCINPCIASLIFLALDLVIGPFGTCKGSLRFGPPFPSSVQGVVQSIPNGVSSFPDKEEAFGIFAIVALAK
jgi:hypothetical protein